MRTITGAHRNSSQDHLLAETKLLPISENLNLICSQFLASASRANHPSHSTIKQPTGARPGRKSIVHTLQSRFGHVVEPFLRDGVLPEADYEKTISAIHTNTVAANKRSLTNKLLGRAPPDVNPEELLLPRLTQCTLCQLRSTF
jgi:hypothetical protein